jgi:sulfide:quinone oxidoreductase
MAAIVRLTPGFSVSPQIAASDVAAIAAGGFRSIVAVRPDAEDTISPNAAEIEHLAMARGLTFRYAPAASHDLLEADTVSRFEAAVAGLEGPVLAYCKSGTRAAIVWALAAARHQPAACVSATLRAAGVDADGIADELLEQPRASSEKPASLAVVCREPVAA